MGDLNINLGTFSEGSSVPGRSIDIRNSGPFSSTLDFSIVSNVSWISPSVLSGVDGGGDLSGINITVGIDISSLTVGSYTGTLTVSDDRASNSPYTIEFSIDVIL